jgi:hypothetical protein
MLKSKEQELIDACFAIGLMISDKRYDLRNQSNEDKAKWIAKQLKGVGFPTTSMGASWGVLKKD